MIFFCLGSVLMPPGMVVLEKKRSLLTIALTGAEAGPAVAYRPSIDARFAAVRSCADPALQWSNSHRISISPPLLKWIVAVRNVFSAVTLCASSASTSSRASEGQLTWLAIPVLPFQNLRPS